MSYKIYQSAFINASPMARDTNMVMQPRQTARLLQGNIATLKTLRLNCLPLVCTSGFELSTSGPFVATVNMFFLSRLDMSAETTLTWWTASRPDPSACPLAICQHLKTVKGS